MKEALKAIANMKVDESTDAEQLFALCQAIARAELEKPLEEPRGCPIPGACSYIAQG